MIHGSKKNRSTLDILASIDVFLKTQVKDRLAMMRVKYSSSQAKSMPNTVEVAMIETI